jgi:pimeloyl-ACP methyl ester carboxylesterase
MSTFGLVHGARSTSKVWRLLVPELEARGHRVMVVDLPVTDPTTTLVDYADIAEAAFADAGEPIIAVGHSMGSGVVVQLEDRMPLEGMILLTPGIFYSPEQAPDAPPALVLSDEEVAPVNGLVEPSREASRPAFWDCPEDLIEHELDQLTGQSAISLAAPFGFHPIKVPSVLIFAEEDGQVSPEWSEWAGKALTGKPSHAIPGSHSPHLARPQELAEIFDGYAKEFEQTAHASPS